MRAALDKVGLLDREKTNPVALSGGEQQRLCIARAIVNRPTILLADEPTGNLDAEYSNEIMNIFKSFHQVGVTLLISTHDESILRQFPARALTSKKRGVAGMKTLIEHLRVLHYTLRRLLLTPNATLLNILVIGIALSLPVGGYVLLKSVQTLGAQIAGTPQISMFPASGTGAGDIERIGDKLKQHPGIKVSNSFRAKWR